MDAACLGNHDLDLGIAEFRNLVTDCNFPWICSNVRQVSNQKPLGNCQEYVVVEKEGLNLLVLGLVESEWIDTLAAIDPDDIEYEGFVDYVKRRVPEVSN